MSPEQARGQEAGPLADVFCWGAILAYATSARLPFGAGTAEAVLYRVVHEEPDISLVPQELKGLVARAMEKMPSSRPSVD